MTAIPGCCRPGRRTPRAARSGRWPAASARRRTSRSSSSQSARGRPSLSQSVRAHSRRWSKKRMLSSRCSSGLISRLDEGVELVEVGLQVGGQVEVHAQWSLHVRRRIRGAHAAVAFVAGLVDRQLVQRHAPQVRRPAPGVLRSISPLAMRWHSRRFSSSRLPSAPSKVAQAPGFGGFGRRRQRQLAAHDVQRVGRHARMKGRLALQLRHGLLAQEAGHRGQQVVGVGRVLHQAGPRSRAPAGTAGRSRSPTHAGRWWRARRCVRRRSGTACAMPSQITPHFSVPNTSQ